MENKNIQIGDTVNIMYRGKVSKTGKVVRIGNPSAFGQGFVVETKGLFADFGKNWAQTDRTTCLEADLEKA